MAPRRRCTVWHTGIDALQYLRASGRVPEPGDLYLQKGHAGESTPRAADARTTEIAPIDDRRQLSVDYCIGGPLEQRPYHPHDGAGYPIYLHLLSEQ
jgi:hypothetical protein